jgi:hypothetical protein
MADFYKADFDNATWLKLSDHLTAELGRKQRLLENFSNTDTETAALRGELRLIRRLLDLPSKAKDPASPVETEIFT